MTTRAEFFTRVRAGVDEARASLPARPAERPAHPAERLAILRRELAERWRPTLDRFRLELERVGGSFHRVADAGGVAGVIAGLARERGGRRVVTWHPRALGVDVGGALHADGLEVLVTPLDTPDPAQLRSAAAAADLGVTGVDLAIAETGSVVVVSGPGRPRSTSLLPPVHVALLERAVLVESLEQAGLALEAWHAGAAPAPGRAINVITGPSRTADIELTLTRGVHGPREIHVVFVDAGLSGDRG